MKNRILLSVLLAATLFGCKKQEAVETPTGIEPRPETTAVVQNECYAYIKGKDTISVKFINKGGKVTGELAYKFFEKDKSFGPISGIAKGDTLIVEYSFQSEGLKSVREAVFLRKSNTLIEGHGDIEEKEGKVIFKDKSSLDFNGNLVLNKIPCK